MGVGHRTRAVKAQITEATDMPTDVPTWEERDTVHTFEDGWSMEWLRTDADLSTENKYLHKGGTCIGPSWQNRLSVKQTHAFLSLRDPDGRPKCTLLLGHADKVIETRAGSNYEPYLSTKIFDQAPRCIDGNPYMSLECVPYGYGVSGVKGDQQIAANEFSARVREWYESLPKAEEYKGFRCDDPMGRVAAADFLKERTNGKTPA